METTLSIPPKGIAAIPHMAEPVHRNVQQVPTVRSAFSAATLPADRFFVAQVVTARLSGTEYPENPAEIAPPERTLKPYDVPMLPYVKDEPTGPAMAGSSAMALQDGTSTQVDPDPLNPQL